MDAEKKPAENVTEAASPPATLDAALPASNSSHNDAGGRAGPAANDKSAALWGLILQVLCAVGVALVIGILALQVTEYLFYKAPPGVWPQQGAGGTFSAPVPLPAPAALAAPLSPVTPATPSTLPASVTTTTGPSETATSTEVGVTSAGVVAATSAPAPAATTP